MNNKFELDTFVYGKTMLEDYAGGSWFKEDLKPETLLNGLLFKPYSSILYDEFKRQFLDGREYCITLIDKDENMKSWTNLTYKQAEQLINDNSNNLAFDNEGYVNIFDMSDAISFSEYEKDLQ